MNKEEKEYNKKNREINKFMEECGFIPDEDF